MKEPISAAIAKLAIDNGIPVLRDVATKTLGRMLKRSPLVQPSSQGEQIDQLTKISALAARVNDLEKDSEQGAQVVKGITDELGKISKALEVLAQRSDVHDKYLRRLFWVVGFLALFAAFALGILLRR